MQDQRHNPALPIIDVAASPVPLRGHTLLCLQGFRGLGYSAAFVEQLGGIHRSLREHPQTLVRPVDQPDAVCAACPHQDTRGCSLNGQGSEADMVLQDRQVLSRLGLQAGSPVPWSEILRRIGKTLTAADLPTICGHCRWLSLGYCGTGIEQLRDDR